MAMAIVTEQMKGKESCWGFRGYLCVFSVQRKWERWVASRLLQRAEECLLNNVYALLSLQWKPGVNVCQ